MGLTAGYFLASAAVIGYILLFHAALSCCGIVLLALTAPLLLYGALAHFSIKNFRTGRSMDFIDPADFGMSIATARAIRTLGLLAPLPLLAYGYFFASGLSWVAMNGSPASVARTYAVIALDERIFGHRMAQREYRRAARIYSYKRNPSLAQMFIRSGIQCAEEHTPTKPSRLIELHTEAGKIAVRSHEWALAQDEFSTALSIAREKAGLDETSRTVRRLSRRLNWLHSKHPESLTFQKQPLTYQSLWHYPSVAKPQQ